jgi:hypothetical protein
MFIDASVAWSRLAVSRIPSGFQAMVDNLPSAIRLFPCDALRRASYLSRGPPLWSYLLSAARLPKAM